MLAIYKNGQTSVILRIKLLDSSSTVGAGLTGLTSASAGLIISTITGNEAAATAYTVTGATIETITTLGTYAAPTATKCRFKEVDATNHKGIYELHFADARFAVASAKALLVSIAGAANLAQADFVVQLQSDDPHVAKPANYASFSIDASGRVDVAKIAGTAQTARDIGASVLLAAATHTGAVIPTVTALTNLPAITANWLTAAGIAATALNGKGDWNIGKTGYALTQAFPANFADLSIVLTTGLINISQVAADKVWDTVLASHLTAGSTGFALNAAGASGDPWSTALPGAYGAGSAGKIIGDNINATILSRATQTSVDTVDDFLDTEIATIKTKTDFLPSVTAGAAGGVFIAGVNAATTANITGNITGNVSGSVGTLTGHTPQTGDAFARLGAPVGASISVDVAGVQTDTNDIQTRLPAVLVGARMDSTLSAIGNSTTALDAFKRAVKGNVIGTVGVGSSTTSVVSSALTPAGSVATQFKGRILTFADDTTTVALRGQATDITASSASATPTFTVTALTTAAVSGDTFVIT